VDVLQKNTEDIRHHISRTDEIQNTNTMLQELILSINERLAPIEQERLKKQAVQEYMVGRAAKWSKILAAAGALVTLIYYIIKIKYGE